MICGVDALDEQILGLLQQDARTPFAVLGRRVGLGTSAVAARVRRLEADGVILGYTVRTSEPRGAGGLEVFIDVRLDAATDTDGFAAAVAPLVLEAVHVTGPYDFLLHTRVRDTAALDGLLKRLKKSCGAASTQTRIALASGPR